MMLLIVVVILCKPIVKKKKKKKTCTHIPHLYIHILTVPEATWVCKHVPSKTCMPRPHIVHLVRNTHIDIAFGWLLRAYLFCICILK